MHIPTPPPPKLISILHNLDDFGVFLYLFYSFYFIWLVKVFRLSVPALSTLKNDATLMYIVQLFNVRDYVNNATSKNVQMFIE